MTRVTSRFVSSILPRTHMRETAIKWFTFSLVAFAVWAFTISRAIPLRNGDRGVFVSMAERLAAGDVLYVDIWDNKEPLFFWTLSLGRLVSPGMDVVIELTWIVLSALAAFAIARTAGASNFLAAASGFIAAPLVIVGYTYAAGFSHLPATCVFLGLTAAVLRQRWLIAGVLLPVLGLYKIITVPMGLAVIIVGLVYLRKGKAPLHTGFGVIISGAFLTGLLAIRGELIGFLELIWSNIGYSQKPLSDAYDLPLWSHIEPVMVPGSVIVVAATAATVLATQSARNSSARILRLMTAWSLGASIGITAITGLWEHHAQIFTGPAVLGAALIGAALQDSPFKWTSALGLVLLAGVILSGGLSARQVVDSALSAPTRWDDLFRVSQAARDVQDLGTGLSYMRLGSNTDDSHAYGLRDYDFACYQFVQYYYDIPSTLEYIPTCLPEADVVIVDDSLAIRSGAPEWNSFVEASESVLTSDFTCRPTEYGRLCIRR